MAVAELERVRWTGDDGREVGKGQGTQDAGVCLTGSACGVTYRR